MQDIIETTEVVVATSPDPGGQDAATTRSVTVKADPAQEYVSSSGWASFIGMVRTMPRWIDDLTRELGTDIYEQMMHDPVVSSSESTKIMSALSKPVSASPCRKEGEPDYELAQEIADFCMANLYGMRRPLSQWLYEMCRGALVNGHKAAEQVYELREVLSGKGPQIVIKALKCKPHRALLFVQDAFNNTVGLAYARPGQVIPNVSVFVPDDPDFAENLIPREKFAVLSWQPENDDPRGKSDLRAIYGWWLLKVSLLPHYNSYLARLGIPLIFATVGRVAQNVPQADARGNYTTPLTPQQALQAAFSTLLAGAGGGIVVGAEGSTATVLEVSSDGEPMVTAVELCDKQIRIQILGQSQSTGEAKFGTRGLGEVHKDVMDLVTDNVRGAVLDMLKTDVLTPLVRYNYGDRGVALMPELSLSEVKQEDMSKWLAGLAAIGYKIAPEHEPELDAKLDLTPREVLTPIEQPQPASQGKQDSQGDDQQQDDAADDDTADSQQQRPPARKAA